MEEFDLNESIKIKSKEIMEIQKEIYAIIFKLEELSERKNYKKALLEYEIYLKRKELNG